MGEAEKKADELIGAAKKARLTKLRQAKDKAEEELKAFREEQETKFQKEIGSRAKTDHMKDMAEATKIAVEAVQKDYDTNKAKTIAYITSKVMDVPIGLTETQSQALKMGVV